MRYNDITLDSMSAGAQSSEEAPRKRTTQPGVRALRSAETLRGDALTWELNCSDDCVVEQAAADLGVQEAAAARTRSAHTRELGAGGAQGTCFDT